MAGSASQPGSTLFLENMTRCPGIHYSSAPLDGISLRAASIHEQTGLVVIAIQDSDGTFLYNPPGDKKLVAGDALLVIANQKQLQTLHKLTGDSS